MKKIRDAEEVILSTILDEDFEALAGDFEPEIRID